MTSATKITIVRIILIPFFVGCAIEYGDTVKSGLPQEIWRHAAAALFFIAAGSDALDGWIARHFNQRSRLGVILDPIADKGLMLAAIITLHLSPWPQHFPLWFPFTIITRDVVCVSGSLLVHSIAGKVDIQPHWTGKFATFAQILCVGWVLMNFHSALLTPLLIVAAALTAVSGVIYVAHGIHQLHLTGYGEAEKP